MSDNWIRLDFCAKMDFFGQLCQFWGADFKKVRYHFFLYVISKKLRFKMATFFSKWPPSFIMFCSISLNIVVCGNIRITIPFNIVNSWVAEFKKVGYFYFPCHHPSKLGVSKWPPSFIVFCGNSVLFHAMTILLTALPFLTLNLTALPFLTVSLQSLFSNLRLWWWVIKTL